MDNQIGSIGHPRFDITAWSSYAEDGDMLFKIDSNQTFIVIDEDMLTGSKSTARAAGARSLSPKNRHGLRCFKVLASQGVGWVLEDNVRIIKEFERKKKNVKSTLSEIR